MTEGTGAYFQRDGESYVPTGLGKSPWTSGAQGGVALAGLIAHIIGRVATPVPLQLARLTIDILGVVPMETLVPAVTVVREGKRVQLIDVTLSSRGRTHVRASALRVRIGTSPTVEEALPYSSPEALGEQPIRSEWGEMVAAKGHLGQPGPAAIWLRFVTAVVAGEPLAPLERVAMLADWSGGLSALVPFSDWSFANLDITLHLQRPPQGEWLLLDAASTSSGSGTAIADGRIGDRKGMFGAVRQAIFVEPRPK